MEFSDNIIKPEGEEIFGGQAAVIIRKMLQEGFCIYGNEIVLSDGSRKKPSILDANKEWNRIKLTYPTSNITRLRMMARRSI
jgi:hypothetical protein